MNQRVRAFIECKEQWHLLKRRARIKAGLSGQSNTDYANLPRLNNNDEQPVWAQCGPPLSQQVQLAIESLNNEFHNRGVPMSPTAHSPRVSQQQPEYSSIDSIEWDCAQEEYGVTELQSSPSIESFSSSGYGGSPASAIYRKRARNRENQRLHRTLSVVLASHLES
jgi:hypothetical protein